MERDNMEPRHRRRRGIPKGIIVIGLVVLVIVFVIAFLIGKGISGKDDEAIVTTETEITGNLLKESLADIGEFATQEYYFTEVETYDSSKKIKDFDIPFTKSRFVYSYDGLIKAGIDFTGVEVDKNDLTKVITVTLPKSKVLSSEIDEGSFQVYDEDQSIFNQISISNFNDANADLKARAEEKAIKRGLLDKADENAKVLIKNFLSSFDIDDYTVTVVVAE